MFIEQAFSDPAFYIGWVVFVMFSICCHEYAHAYAAACFGDDTAARNGHLSLNPLVQMGLQSLIILALFGIAWGAVPVNGGLVRSPHKRALIALAGPLSNLLLCLVFSLLAVILKVAGVDGAFKLILIAGAVNGMLFVFNILPVPMLDGYAAVSAYRASLEQFARRHAAIIFLIFILLLWNTPLGAMIFGAGYSLAALFTGFWSALAALIV